MFSLTYVYLSIIAVLAYIAAAVVDVQNKIILPGSSRTGLMYMVEFYNILISTLLIVVSYSIKCHILTPIIHYCITIIQCWGRAVR